MSVEQTVENVYLRQEAVQLTRKHFLRLLGMILLITLTVSFAHAGLTVLGDLLLAEESQRVLEAAQAYTNHAQITSANALLSAQTALITSPKYLLYNFVFIILTSLLTYGLSLGRHAQLLNAGRGSAPHVLGGFCRMRQCAKAWLLTLWTAFKLLLWAMPGMILVAADVTLWQDASNAWLTAIGLGLSIVLTIPAALRYCLAAFILADEPDRGVRECVTLSKGLMAGRKRQCFRLGVPMILKMIGAVYGIMILLSVPVAMLGAYEETPSAVMYILVLVMLAAMALACGYFGIQMDMAYALFYLKRREPATDAPASYWLRDHVAESPALPAESPVDSPEDITPETNEKKENPHEEPDR